MKYKWDDSKNCKNIRKHKISFEEVISIFSDPYTIMDVYDWKHSIFEHRYYAFGYLPTRYCKVMVSYTYRDEDVIRIISVRKVR